MKKQLLYLSVMTSFFVMGNAYADDLVYGPISIINDTAHATAVHLENGVFSDIFNFVDALSTQGAAIGLSFHLDGASGVTFSDVSLNGIPGGTIATQNGNVSFFLSNVAPDNLGNYQLKVSGTAFGIQPNIPADYGVTLNVSAVPEPSNTAMLFGGLGILTLLITRRNRNL